jgi:alpha-amylase
LTSLAANNKKKLKEIHGKDYEDESLIDTWRALTTSDHFYYMCTKWFADGDVHKYFNPYESPYEAYINYQNVLKDFSQTVEKALEVQLV